MKIVLDLTPEEYRAAYTSIAFLLRPRHVREDPESRDLRSWFDKYREAPEQILCDECESRIVYAKGKCRSCYRLKSA